MFKGKVVWVTGASSGIGEALAVAFRLRGASLILSGRRQAELERVAAACGGAEHCLVLPFEAVDFQALPGVVATALAWRGAVDVLVNNAGVSQRSLALDTDFSVYRSIIDIDLLAPIALTQRLLPHMVERGSGRIIAISSVAGKAGVPMRTGYCAAKHGIFGYFDALRSEITHRGIMVHVVAPGSVRTNVARNALTSDGVARGESDAAIENGYTASEAAERILSAVARGKREVIVARGVERLAVQMRRYWPEMAFDRIAAAVARGYADRLGVKK
jgi:dehydrogenase/reductase SDR family member 7B